MQISLNQIKNGLSIELNSEIYFVVDSKHVKPGKGGAFMRVKLRNIRLGTVVDKTFRPNEKFEVAYIEKKKIQFMYHSKDIYEFMDQETYEHVSLHKDQLGDVVNYLKENLEVAALTYKNKILSLEPPIFIDMGIVSTEPGIRGDTSRAGTKPAKTETGMTILVPLFVNEGDVIRVDTRTKEYVSRA
ncbi:MAG: elongation factor P [Candidatus Omnitrophica bacterium]|nr:elongation factor P [Candidatus Omnitrophota bacterium]MBU4590455.1 elongation factor P [Candidatus Omnitrophota bacterium]